MALRLLAFVAAMLLASSAIAQSVCGERSNLSKSLKSDYAETIVAAGLDKSGGLIEVYASDEGSWTILLTMPNGATCIVSAGDYWRLTRQRLPGAPS